MKSELAFTPHPHPHPQTQPRLLLIFHSDRIISEGNWILIGENWNGESVGEFGGGDSIQGSLVEEIEEIEEAVREDGQECEC